MHRSVSIFIIIIALLPIFLFLFYTPHQSYETQFDVNHEDRETLLEYSYHILYEYFGLDNESHSTVLELSTHRLPYDILFITLLSDGKVRGCQSGSTKRNQENRIFSDIREALVESIEDDRFGGRFQIDELPQCEIMFTFLYNISWLYNTSLPFLQNNIELGIHAIELFQNNTSTIFKESVPIENNYDLEYTLERLCEKAGLHATCYTDEDVDLFRYDTLTFMGKKDSEITELYRYSILLNLSEITQDVIYRSITSASQWYMNNTQPGTHLLEYWYYPSSDTYSTDTNHIRQLASLWALTELQSFLPSSNLSALIHSSLDHYNAFRIDSENISYIMIDGEANLASNAFLILSLLRTPDYAQQQELLDQYAQGILSLQSANGSFQTFFTSEEMSGENYYPGEAMLSLMNLYINTSNDEYLDAVQHGFSYYRDYWRDNKSTAFVPWHSQTYALLFDVTQDVEVAEFIFEMNDWLIDSYQIQTSDFKDELGGFPRYFPTFTTSVFLEGISDAYAVALAINDSIHIEKYGEAIRNGTRFILQTQWTYGNSFYVENTSKTIGGFKTSLTDNSIRIDNTQHAVMALMKVYNQKIFAK